MLEKLSAINLCDLVLALKHAHDKQIIDGSDNVRQRSGEHYLLILFIKYVKRSPSVFLFNVLLYTMCTM